MIWNYCREGSRDVKSMDLEFDSVFYLFYWEQNIII